MDSETVPDRPKRDRSSGSTSHPASPHADFRSRILGIEFRLSTRPLRPGAAKQVQTYIRAGYRQCVDMDLSKFFDRVQHDVLMVRVRRRSATNGC